MFFNAKSFVGGDLSRWDTSAVIDMRNTFDGADNFLGIIDTWNVSNVQDFGLMFHSCPTFDGNLSMWDTSNAEAMDAMFSYAYKFEGEGLSKWNTGNVKSMKSMFYAAYAFNCDISNWDTSKVQDTSEMVRNIQLSPFVIALRVIAQLIYHCFPAIPFAC